jgi:hypothetical protein
MKVFDNYEISPCRRYEEPDNPGKFFFEVCEPHEADVWTLYGHIEGEGVEAIGDFPTCVAAKEFFFRITGTRFTGSYRAEEHLRIMHAGPKLLEALHALAEATSCYARHFYEHKCALAVIAEATFGLPEPRLPIVIEVRGGVVQDVLNVPYGIAYEIRDYDRIEAEGSGRMA